MKHDIRVIYSWDLQMKKTEKNDNKREYLVRWEHERHVHLQSWDPFTPRVSYWNVKIKGLFMWAELTGLTQLWWFCFTSNSFGKFVMCSIEKVGWPSYQDLSLSNWHLYNWVGNFPIWTGQPSYQYKKFSSTHTLLSKEDESSIILTYF